MMKEGNVTVMVANMNRSIQFYTEALGLKLKYRHGDDWAEVEAPGLTIGLHLAGKVGPQPGKSESLSIGFTVEKIDAAIGTLKKKGVTFSPHRVDEGPVLLAFFSDPDGNPLYLCEVKEPAGSHVK